MTDKKVVAPCKHGAECAHRKLGKCKFGHVEAKLAAGKPKVKHVQLKMTANEVLCVARSLLKRKAMLESASAVATAAPAPPKGWALVPDVKASAVSPGMVDALKDAYASELKVARGVLASAFGTKPVLFRLPVGTELSSTVTTGVVNTVATIDITQSLEFTSLAALFDEYRFRKGRFAFTVLCPTNTAVLGTSSLTLASCFAIGFDPADSTVATSVVNIVQLQYHVILAPRVSETPTLGTYVGLYGRQDNHMQELVWHYETTSAITGNGGVVAPGMWKSTQGNVTTFPDGVLKPYYASGETTVKPCVAGIQYWDVEFRCRT